MFLSTALATALAEPPGQPAERMIAEATDWLLNGEDLPPDTNARLKRLEPKDRARVLVFLRRSGLMTGPEWTVDDLLAPAEIKVTPR